MPFDIAKLNEKKQEARGAAEKDQKAKSKAARAAARRRWSAPAGSARGTPRGGDADRRRSTPPMPPPPPLAAAAALEDRERRQSQHFSYDEMPVHAGYVRERDYSGSSAEAATTAAVNKMGHAYVDASVVVRGIEQLSKDKCEHCNRRCPVEAVGETRRGVSGGTFDFKCTSCFATRRIPLASKVGRSDEGTSRIVAAATTEGMGKAQINRFLTKMDIPKVNNKVHARVAKKIDAAAAAEFDQMSSAALEREKAATLLMEGEACRSKTGKIMITIISDGTWQKRYGRNSLAGFVGVYGLYTGECLYAGSKMARCAACSYRKNKGQPTEEHDCSRTWNEAPNRDGATSNMEKVITLEAVEAIYEKGAVVGTLVTDGDTKTLAYIKSNGPEEVAEEIEGSQDLGHLAKNLKKRLYELNLSGSLKGLIPEAQQERLRKLFANVVHKHREENKGAPLEGQAEALQKKLRVIAPHQFKYGEVGTELYDHCPCGPWCKLKPSNTGIYDPNHIPGSRNKFIDQKARAGVIKVFENHSTIELCSRLLLDCSTNVAESANSLLWLRYLHKAFLRPRLSGLAWNLTQLQKKYRAIKAGEKVMVRAGLAPLKPAAKKAADSIDGRDKK